MTIERLAELAKACRDAQLAYADARSTDTLQAAKAAERRLDDAIAEVLANQRRFAWEEGR